MTVRLKPQYGKTQRGKSRIQPTVRAINRPTTIISIKPNENAWLIAKLLDNNGIAVSRKASGKNRNGASASRISPASKGFADRPVDWLCEFFTVWSVRLITSLLVVVHIRCLATYYTLNGSNTSAHREFTENQPNPSEVSEYEVIQYPKSGFVRFNGSFPGEVKK